MDGRPTIILYGNREHKILPFARNGPKTRYMGDLFLNFDNKPSVGLILITDKLDAQSIMDSAERLGVNAAMFDDYRKAHRTLRSLVGF